MSVFESNLILKQMNKKNNNVYFKILLGSSYVLNLGKLFPIPNVEFKKWFISYGLFFINNKKKTNFCI